jgi:N-hydroxyarylamine O-acetyltransferase
MDTDVFNAEAYLERIHFTGSVRPTEDLLIEIQRAQLHTIPFENFDILLERGISLEPAAICKKLVNRKRGGYCFELNGLFRMALQAFGFEARALLARVHLAGTPGGRGHQIALVTIGGRQWIADVGFGNPGLRIPIPLELDRPFPQGGRQVRLTAAGHVGTMLQARVDGQWQNLYSFEMGHVFPADILYGNHYASTHPNSLFTSARIAALAIEGGVITLMNTTLKRTVAGNEQVQTLVEGPDYLEALQTHFNIELDADYDDLRPLPDAGQALSPVFGP